MMPLSSSAKPPVLLNQAQDATKQCPQWKNTYLLAHVHFEFYFALFFSLKNNPGSRVSVKRCQKAFIFIGEVVK